MVRRKGTSRVGGPARSSEGAIRSEPSFPSLRQRRPVLFWIVILAVVAMVLSTIASFVSALL